MSRKSSVIGNGYNTVGIKHQEVLSLVFLVLDFCESQEISYEDPLRKILELEYPLPKKIYLGTEPPYVSSEDRESKETLVLKDGRYQLE